MNLSLKPLINWTDEELRVERMAYAVDILKANSQGDVKMKKFLYECARPIKKEIARREIEKRWFENGKSDL